MMRNDRWWLAPVMLAASALLSAQRADAAGGAYAVDDAEIGKVGECQVESWISFASNHDLIATTTPACVVNLGIPVELDVVAQRMRADSVWTTTAGIAGKANLIPIATGKFGLAVSGGANWDTATGNNTSNYLMVPVTYEQNKKLRFNFNAGWQYDAINRIHYASWGAGFEWGFADKLTLIGEVYGLAGQSIPGKNVTSPRAQLGLRFNPTEKIDLDLIYGRNIAGENANWITIGLNLRF